MERMERVDGGEWGSAAAGLGSGELGSAWSAIKDACCGCFSFDARRRPLGVSSSIVLTNLMSSLVWRYWYRKVPYDMVQLVVNGLHNPPLSQ